MRFVRIMPAALAALVAIAVSGCGPSISPLYRDFDVRTDTDDVRASIAAALSGTRWKTVSTTEPHVIATDTVTVRRYGLYRVDVSLEIAPVGGRYVRLFVHPYRRYFTGVRRKIPYFKRSLRRTILPELNEAFEAQGLFPLGSAVERDKRSRPL